MGWHRDQCGPVAHKFYHYFRCVYISFTWWYRTEGRIGPLFILLLHSPANLSFSSKTMFHDLLTGWPWKYSLHVINQVWFCHGNNSYSITLQPLTLRAISSGSPPLMRMPFCAPTPVPTMTAVGAASPKAQGHAIANTVMEVLNANLIISSALEICLMV